MQSASRESLTFIVPVRNDEASLERCLRSIQRDAGSTAAHIVVADNGSTDGTAAAARRLGADVLVLPGVKVGELRNRAAAAAERPLVAFVDADHEIASGWIDAALSAFADARVAAAGAPYSSPPRPTWVQRIYDAFRVHNPAPRDVSWLGAGNLVVRREVFASVNGFDTSLEACEDVDFCQRLTQAGFSLRSDPRMRSVHYGDPRTLKALFLSELWRGRDNLRVSLRGPLTPGSLPSIVIPILDLAALVTIVVAAILGSGLTAAGAFTGLLALAALRAAVLWRRLESRTVTDLGRTFAVASAYDLARALALVFRMPHRRARNRQPAAATR